MSDKKAATINIYQVFDNELARMHELFKIYLSHPKSGNYYVDQNDTPRMYKRIVEMQNVLIKQFANRDEIIQEKVAELALTGITDPESK